MSSAEKSLSSSPEESKKKQFNGNILIFYAYDVGDSIDTNKIRQKKMIDVVTATPFPHFKNYHVPLSVSLPNREDGTSRSDCISLKVHNFGAISFCYKIPFCETLDHLKVKLIESVEQYGKISADDAATVFEMIKGSILEPAFFNLNNMYYAVQLDNKDAAIDNKSLVKNYGHMIASLLRLETKVMAEYQRSDILESATGYFSSDTVIIDGEAAFIFDSEYFDTLEFLELANIQKLELQTFDKMLDKRLSFFYSSDTYKIPWKAYVPLLGSRVDSLLVDLARLRVDISVISERVNNHVNMTGDSYFEELYELLIKKMKLKQWKVAIDEKLSIISEMYTVRKNRLETIREEMLTVVIIILIAIEATIAFIK
jgi:hypothetical protein